MAIVTTNSNNYANIAAAIREKTGSEETFTPEQMASAIANIQGGGGGDLELEKIIYSPTSQRAMSNFNFQDYAYLTILPLLDSSSNICSFKVPEEINTYENIMPVGMYNSSNSKYSLYDNYSYPMYIKLTDATTLSMYLYSGGYNSQKIFDTLGNGKAIVFGLKKVSPATTFRMRRPASNLIREEGNLIPLIVNENMLEEEIISLFYALEPTEGSNIYILNNPFVTPGLIEVAQFKGYNIIQNN